jgi:dihydroorotate dehydrogenase
MRRTAQRLHAACARAAAAADAPTTPPSLAIARRWKGGRWKDRGGGRSREGGERSEKRSSHAEKKSKPSSSSSSSSSASSNRTAASTRPAWPPPVGGRPVDPNAPSVFGEPSKGVPKFATFAAATALSGGLFVALADDATTSRLAFAAFRLAAPALRAMDAETAHNVGIALMERGIAPAESRRDDPALRVERWGLTFPNPIGLAAGFDKDARAFPALRAMGFGSVEIGSVTPRPQPGNAKPRVFRLPNERAVVNRYGFTSEGHDAAVARLASNVPQVRSIHWSPYDRVGVVNADP